MRDGKFATAINCIDGRVQVPVLDWIRSYLNVDYVDLITEPGPDKVITYGTEWAYNSIFEKATLSIKTLGSRSISIVGHYDCRANPISKEEHIDQIQRSVEIIEEWRLGVRILGLWVNEWRYVDLIKDTEKKY
ncbi:MAG TPA: carbonic anhydrase [Blastocatellia bacterium]|nr:carbonic anhydrase [Blastocatellia bacterium]